jgi:hypothetical protein
MGKELASLTGRTSVPAVFIGGKFAGGANDGGLGGVLTWQDAAEFILVGASAVGVGTALFVDPRKPVELAHGLAAWLREQRASRVADLVGAMEG